MPSITVIIPLYNKEHYVIRAVQSLLEQTQKPDQIIIINDAIITDNGILITLLYSSLLNILINI